MPGSQYDVVIVGAGPNGLSAGIVLAQRGLSVLILEARDRPGGGARSAELTLPGFQHDICSAVHPLAVGSPFFQTLPLGNYGLEWVHSPSVLAHPMDEAPAVLLHRSVSQTAKELGQDQPVYERLLGPLVKEWEKLAPEVLGPLRIPSHPLLMARFGYYALRSAALFAQEYFEEPRAQALFAGMAAHAMLPLDRAATAAFGLILCAAGHACGWPIPKGGAQRLTQALVEHYQSLGGEIQTQRPVRALSELPECRAVLLDLTPRQVLAVAGGELPKSYERKLTEYRYGPGAFKVDYALSGPIPWKDPRCKQAVTVHLGGGLEQIAWSEQRIAEGLLSNKPFVIAVQPTLFDPERAPEGKHVVWAYCHVPLGSSKSMAKAIDAQFERFAPGFGEKVLAKMVLSPRDLEAYNANYVGGDINGGTQDLGQLFNRPVWSAVPYATPNPKLYLCSSSTPPGGGVHGMCGYHAAKAVLKRVFGL